MQEHDDLSPSELLQAFIEGNLGAAHEPILFNQLAGNAELRAELRDHLLIRSFVHHDSDHLLPSDALRSRVFDAVGVAPEPRGGVADLRIVHPQSRLLLTALLSAIVASLLTLGASRLIDGDDTLGISQVAADPAPRQGGTAPDSDPKIAPAPIVSSTTPTGSMGMRHGAAALSHRGTSSPPVSPPARRRAAAMTAPVENETKVATASDATIYDVREASARRVRVIASDPVPADHLLYAPEPAPALSAFPEMIAEPEHRLGVELRGISSRSFPANEIAPKSRPMFSDMSLGVRYALGSDQAIVAEIGQEAFAQRFSGDENGRGVQYRQTPLLPWGAVGYQYGYGTTAIRPFGRALLGGTEVGPLGIAIIGAEYRPDTRAIFSIGLQGSLLAYRFQEEWFASRKIGITYGATVLF